LNYECATFRDLCKSPFLLQFPNFGCKIAKASPFIFHKHRRLLRFFARNTGISPRKRLFQRSLFRLSDSSDGSRRGAINQEVGVRFCLLVFMLCFWIPDQVRDDKGRDFETGEATVRSISITAACRVRRHSRGAAYRRSAGRSATREGREAHRSSVEV